MKFSRPSKISVFGLGYVGTVTAACLASLGHKVIGIDVDSNKMKLMSEGRSPIIEERIGELIAEVVATGQLTVEADLRRAINATDLSFICVGTPSDTLGRLSTEYLGRVTQEIGRALSDKRDRHVVAFRSTMPPGTCENLLIPLLEELSGKIMGVDLGVCVNPEFLREGTSVRDFLEPSKTVVGAKDEVSVDSVLAVYADLPGKRFSVPIKVAEMTKYVDNSYHALKVAFANEIGAICSAAGVDSADVMKPFLADTKLNLGPAYLNPGFAFGGSCLPKDLRALLHVARSNSVEVPVLANLLRSNDIHLRRALDLIVESGRRKVGIFGLSFKAGTDDLRESPMVELCERLIGKGFDVRIFDPNVSLARVVGANRSYVMEKLPHLNELLVEDILEVLDHGDVIVIGAAGPDVVSALSSFPEDRMLVDLVRLPNAAELRSTPNYRGIAW